MINFKWVQEGPKTGVTKFFVDNLKINSINSVKLTH